MIAAIRNLTDLAREAGSLTGVSRRQQEEINAAVRKHTGGFVWLGFSNAAVILYSEYSIDRLVYPFFSDDFWKGVEYLQEEAIEGEEDA